MHAAILSAIGIAFGLLSPAAQTPANNGYTFQTLDNHADPTFNVLTGINNKGVISGYYGSGQSGHPSRGFTLSPPYGQQAYHSVTFPGSQQTQVNAINNRGDVMGSYIDGKGNGSDFVRWNGHFQQYDRGPLGGLNDAGITVWTHGQRRGPIGANVVDLLNRYRHVTQVAAGQQVVGNALNQRDDVAGLSVVLTDTFGWAVLGGQAYSFEYVSNSYSYVTELLGINDADTLVGFYTGYYGTHGLIITHVKQRYPTYTQLDHPLSSGSTILRAINDQGQIVGTFIDNSGNTHGFLATPAQALLPRL